MTRTIKYQESKAERKREREKIGRLRDQRITPGTKDRYEAALQQVAAFAGVSVPRLLASSGLDDLLSSFIEKLWEDGDTKTMASYALASVQYHRPAIKGHLQQSWKLLSLWTKLEQPMTPNCCWPSRGCYFGGNGLASPTLPLWASVACSAQAKCFTYAAKMWCYRAIRIKRQCFSCMIQKQHNGICFCRKRSSYAKRWGSKA